MAFPESGILDNFNRDNEGPPLSANWTETGYAGAGFEVVGNEGQGEVMNAACAEYWNAATFGANCEAYLTVTDIDASFASIGVIARLVNSGGAGVDGYNVGVESYAPGNIKIKRIDDGSFTQLGASIGKVPADGDKVGVEIVGSDINAYYDDGGAGWGEVGTRSDATYAGAGHIGIGLYTNSNVAFTNFDDFGGGTLAAAGRTTRNTDSHPLGIHSGMGHRFGNP